MICAHHVRHQPGAAQLRRLRSAAAAPRRQRATCSAHSEVESRQPEYLADAVPAVLAACIAALWATAAPEPQKVDDVWPQQRQTVVHTTERASDAVSLNMVLVDDDMGDSDELVVPQSPNPGELILFPPSSTNYRRQEPRCEACAL